MNTSINVSYMAGAKCYLSLSDFAGFDNTTIERQAVQVSIFDEYSNAMYLYINATQANELADALTDIAMTIKTKYAGTAFKIVEVTRPTVEAEDGE